MKNNSKSYAKFLRKKMENIKCYITTNPLFKPLSEHAPPKLRKADGHVSV